MRCQNCNGRKVISSLGFQLVSCKPCNGTGIAIEEKPVETPKVDEVKVDDVPKNKNPIVKRKKNVE